MDMNAKQQVATGFLALVIVGSIAFMPVSAGEKAPLASVPRTQGAAVAQLGPSEPSHERVRDLTYN
jgi:hypothetical protein